MMTKTMIRFSKIKVTIAIILALMLSLFLYSCSSLNLGIAATPLETELNAANKIVFTNCKEKTLKITVSDLGVIKQISAIISKRKAVKISPEVDGDYTIRFYFPDGSQKDFTYWMGAAENNKNVNFMDGDGNYYTVSENLDIYIVNSTKMQERPDNFVQLYSTALSQYISTLQKAKSGATIVGVDITSDRMMRKYTKSYEDEKILKGISGKGYYVMPVKADGKYTYIITYVTGIYNPDKASINIEALKTADKTVTSTTVDYKLVGKEWNKVENKK